MFAPAHGVVEGPATGNASGPLGCYLVEHGLVSADAQRRITSKQGVAMGRASRIHVVIDGTPGAIADVKVGGEAVLVGSRPSPAADGSAICTTSSRRCSRRWAIPRWENQRGPPTWAAPWRVSAKSRKSLRADLHAGPRPRAVRGRLHTIPPGARGRTTSRRTAGS
jgi:hypothetical protein